MAAWTREEWTRKALALRRKVFGLTRKEIRAEAAKVQAALTLTQEQLRVTSRELLESSEELRTVRAACQSKDSALFDFRARVQSLESDNRDLRRQVGDKTAAVTFTGFLAEELKQQVAIQRDMIARHKVIDEIVDAARDRPSEAVRQSAISLGQARGIIQADHRPVGERPAGDPPKGRRRNGPDRKPGKGTSKPGRVRGKA